MNGSVAKGTSIYWFVLWVLYAMLYESSFLPVDNFNNSTKEWKTPFQVKPINNAIRDSHGNPIRKRNEYTYIGTCDIRFR